MPATLAAEPTTRRTSESMDGWTERTTPELFKFERPGTEVIGFLRKCFRELAEGKQVPTYLIETDDHTFVKVRATYDLMQKIQAEDTGSRIRILFEGEQETSSARDGGNKMMKFKVWIKPGPKRQNNPNITDEDVPF